MSTKAETRERVLAAARRLLVERGYYGAGIDEIAREAGITRQAIYQHHFPSKTELLLALLDHVDRVEGIDALFVPVQRAGDVRQALRCLVEAVAVVWSRVGAVARMLDGARATDAAAEAAWQSRDTVRRRGLDGLVRRAKRQGLLVPGWTPTTAGDFALSLLSVGVHHHLVVECGWSARRYVVHLDSCLARALFGDYFTVLGPAPFRR
ncbi:MAG: TetR/AcrR family transcriptional regulator [Polyangiaceae bacterium]